ncbi:MAG: hypothetical protein ABIS86_07085 [Streptosporangiaceae bacterium]
MNVIPLTLCWAVLFAFQLVPPSALLGIATAIAILALAPARLFHPSR